MSQPLRVPALSLVVLVGVAGSGKSTFAARHFRPTQVVSSDGCRALVADDPRDQSATGAAFEVAHLVTRHRLANGLLTVLDATSVEPAARRPLLELAREHDVPAVAIVLDLPEELCARRAAERPDRAVAAAVVHRQHMELRAGLHGLRAEGFAAVHVLRTEAEAAGTAVDLVGSPLDRRAEQGPFDIVGDVHGCLDELEELLGRLGYEIARDGAGRAVGAHHPTGRRAVFVGDLVDRGPDPAGVLRLAMGMVAAGDALAVAGNHEHKLVRALGRAGAGVGAGGQAKVGGNLARTLELLGAEPAEFQAAAFDFCAGLAGHLVLDGGALVVAHAGLKEAYHGRDSDRALAFALFGDTTGERDEYGLPVRLPWAEQYRGRATVVYGHTPMFEHRWVNNTLCVDTGCCFGGSLTALRYPERELVSVQARREHYPPVRPLRHEPGVAAS
ncbi:AAA family ATPase [Frankia sp. CNm7]|uniref:AAA family ATPase n=1 Tax=Frankia nepalensis TaxID=1836974 RepID=A0A937RN41_9ACTN|nr:AAA family ATPase [Frankia nepalensis]MBL7497232.1 AAA family ATPase [Frankia nepalensis]MBL7512934.1 AAA family ATPase [Frankia nepalensis]MBL7524682.1 AAA family ATPase [Frankia nepalensis]MBL7633507.1 AAA family ATPase [Frankia nepalensis]